MTTIRARTENATPIAAPMKPELKAKWVAALRSGKYQQTHGALKDCSANGYCCLGVLLDVSGLGEWIGPAYAIDKDGERRHCDGDLSRFGRIHVGLLSAHEEKLIGMNDGDKNKGIAPVPFEEIALWIEQNL